MFNLWFFINKKIKINSVKNIIKNKGSIFKINIENGISHLCHKNIFWGFPIGVKDEPTLTDIAVNIISLDKSFSIYLEIVFITGISINKAISFVKKADKDKAKNIIKRNNCLSVWIWFNSFSLNSLKYPLSSNAVAIVSKPVKVNIVL